MDLATKGRLKNHFSADFGLLVLFDYRNKLAQWDLWLKKTKDALIGETVTEIPER